MTASPARDSDSDAPQVGDNDHALIRLNAQAASPTTVPTPQAMRSARIKSGQVLVRTTERKTPLIAVSQFG